MRSGLASRIAVSLDYIYLTILVLLARNKHKGTISGILMIGCQFLPTHLSSSILSWYLNKHWGRNFKYRVFMLDKGGFHSVLAQWVVSWVKAKPSATSVLIFTVECTPCYINIIYACVLNKMTPYLFNGNSEGDR